MVNITENETFRIVQIILTIGIMVVLLGTIFFLDFFKKQEKKKALLLLIIMLMSMITGLLVIGIMEITAVVKHNLEIWLYVNIIGILVVTIVAILLSEKLKKGAIRSLFVGILAILYILLILIVVLIWNEGTLDYDSLHLGSTLGLSALILVTIGTLLVIYDESKYSLFHGYSAGGAWIITLLNTVTLFMLTSDLAKGYSGWLHALHIICGAVGLTFGFASALFGISGQRRLAKVTGYTTLACWWLAYGLGFFIEFANTGSL